MKKKQEGSGNRRIEHFCRFYAAECWGDAEGAAGKAGFRNPGEKGEALLEQPEVIGRIRQLRGQRAGLSVADDAWIRDAFIEIVRNAEKDSDRIRALAGLQKSLAEAAARKGKRLHAEPSFEQGELPLFEGCEDGEGSS